MELSYLRKIFRIARQAWKLPVPASVIEQARETLELLGHVTPSEERDRRPTADKLDRLCAHFNANPRQQVPMEDVIRFAVATAMRAGEIMSLRWADLDEMGRTILIRDRKDSRRKNGNNQLVPLLPDAMAIVLRQPRTSDQIFPWPAARYRRFFPEPAKSWASSTYASMTCATKALAACSRWATTFPRWLFSQATRPGRN